MPPPTVIGATGGSGTRAFATVLQSAGIFMGSRLNGAGDSLDLAQVDWLWGKPYLAAEMAGETPPVEEMHDALQKGIASHLADQRPAGGEWGWKHPHSYLLLPWLDSVIGGLRFVHVVRDGRRMAFSGNQKQPQHYGNAVFGAAAESWEQHVLAIRFWAWANERAADYGERHMDGRYLRVRFEDLCRDPPSVCARLLSFARGGEQTRSADVANAAQLIHEPPTVALERHLVEELEREGSRGLKRFGYL
jgi:Sulfotransferase family